MYFSSTLYIALLLPNSRMFTSDIVVTRNKWEGVTRLAEFRYVIIIILNFKIIMECKSILENIKTLEKIVGVLFGLNVECHLLPVAVSCKQETCRILYF